MTEHTTGDAATKVAPVLAWVEEVIGADLLQAEAILQQELASTNPYVSDILQHATRFRGKRLRPMLLLLTGEACGGIRPAHHTLAAVVEMIHVATLVHDDVLDEASTRRHVATVNSRWNNETSVLFGDYLFTHSFHLASSLDTTHACRLIGRATNIVCEGELSQIKERGNLDLTEDAYFRIIDGKTAELTALCGHLGAYYADCPTETVLALERYGRKLGLAFQIADDVLDLVGNEHKTGKSLGSDLQKQKLTLPLIRLLATANEADGQAIRQILLHPDETTRQRLQPYLDRSDALTYAHQRALALAAEARDELNVLQPSRARRILSEIAEFAVQRTF
jgi:octaprenyl-diphosphate synthase